MPKILPSPLTRYKICDLRYINHYGSRVKLHYHLITARNEILPTNAPTSGKDLCTRAWQADVWVNN